MGAGASVATLIVVRPGIEVKTVKGNALGADGHLSEIRAHLGVEPVAVHAEVDRRVPEPENARLKLWAVRFSGHVRLPHRGL